VRILVTGGAGFIGGRFCRMAMSEGCDVTAYDRLRAECIGPSVDDRLAASGVTLIKGDILDRERLLSAAAGHDALVHFAADSFVPRCQRVPMKSFLCNAGGTAMVLDVAREAGIPRAHYVSTIYADWGIMQPHEVPQRDLSVYAAGKMAGELAVAAWSSSDLRTSVTRGCNTYGPRQTPDRLVSGSIVRAIQGWSLLAHGDGSDTREWVHVDDHCRAIWEVLLRGEHRGTYAVATNERRSNLDVLQRIASEVGLSNESIEHVGVAAAFRPEPSNDVPSASRLGWRPMWTMEEGLGETVEWYRRNETWWRGFTGFENVGQGRPNDERR